jgi:hypothetical protein
MGRRTAQPFHEIGLPARVAKFRSARQQQPLRRRSIVPTGKPLR